MERFASLFRRIFPVLLFVVAFLPRAVQPVSRPLVWYLRSAHFIEAVLAGDWANTVYSEHPGVPLMWLAGIGLKVYWTLSGVTPAAQAVPPDFEPIHFFGPVPVTEIAAALAPLALLVGLGIVGIYLMLRRLFDGATAAVAGLLLALSPYYLAQSKILHLEALLATLMLLSALALLIYRRERGELHCTRWLLLSGVLGGLALLVKTPALFLVPFSGMVLLVDAIGKSANRQTGKPAIRNLQSAICNSLLWLLLAALVYVAFWPAMWVDPGRGLAAVGWGLTHHAGTAHDTPTFFLGRVLREDPGPLFYGVTLLFRTGEVELTFLAVAVMLGMAQWLRRRRISQAGVDGLLLAAYAVFFLAQMSLGAKKMPRYVLPALLALDVLAAAGIVTWARGLARLFTSRPPSVPPPPLSPPQSWGGRWGGMMPAKNSDDSIGSPCSTRAEAKRANTAPAPPRPAW
jgi:4-amino-4-deoxy-L-arabinose transferase-like glycosyltransferase